jgi:hypothetical protein
MRDDVFLRCYDILMTSYFEIKMVASEVNQGVRGNKPNAVSSILTGCTYLYILEAPLMAMHKCRIPTSYILEALLVACRIPTSHILEALLMSRQSLSLIIQKQRDS